MNTPSENLRKQFGKKGFWIQIRTYRVLILFGISVGFIAGALIAEFTKPEKLANLDQESYFARSSNTFRNILPSIFLGISTSLAAGALSDYVIRDIVEKTTPSKQSLMKLLGLTSRNPNIAIVLPAYQTKPNLHPSDWSKVFVPGIFAKKITDEDGKPQSNTQKTKTEPDRVMLSHGDLIGTLFLVAAFQEAGLPIKDILFDSFDTDPPRLKKAILTAPDDHSKGEIENYKEVRLTDEIKKDYEALIAIGLRSNELTAWLYGSEEHSFLKFEGQDLKELIEEDQKRGYIARSLEKKGRLKKTTTVLIIGGSGSDQTWQTCEYLANGKNVNDLLNFPCTEGGDHAASTVADAEGFRILLKDIEHGTSGGYSVNFHTYK